MDCREKFQARAAPGKCEVQQGEKETPRPVMMLSIPDMGETKKPPIGAAWEPKFSVDFLDHLVRRDGLSIIFVIALGNGLSIALDISLGSDLVISLLRGAT